MSKEEHLKRLEDLQAMAITLAKEAEAAYVALQETPEPRKRKKGLSAEERASLVAGRYKTALKQ